MLRVPISVLSLFAACAMLCGCGLQPDSDRVAKAAEDPETTTGEKKKKHKANRLAKELSPYLLLHKNNPVDWYPWGPEAFAKAKKENKPIFLSIGYSSCYWCHVMERKVFENEKIAAYMNKHFVNVKVDREERPDVDDIYMNSLHVFFQMIGSRQGGGWPLSMFLTPDGKPFLGGTYFPPEDDKRSGRPGFLAVCQLVHKIWTERKKDVEANATAITNAVKRITKPGLAIEKIDIDRKLVALSAKDLIDSFDDKHGGIGFDPRRPNAPKFPTPVKLNLLTYQIKAAKDRDAAKVIEKTLDEVAWGGIRDHLAGGFHRYSTDRKWHVPHFEKMLYDQSQLASLYLEAWSQSKKPLYREITEEILDFVLAEMTDEKGGFHSALDAETDGIEGKHYVWSKAEIEKVLGPTDAKVFFDVYGLGKEKTFEHGYVLHLSEPLAATAKRKGIETARFKRALAQMRADLLKVRNKRKALLKDDKVLTAWNGLMIRAYADAGAAFNNSKYIKAAERAAMFVLSNMRNAKGRLLRTWRKGTAKLNAYQSDYAYLVSGLLALHKATGDKKWVNAAQRLTDDMLSLYWDKTDGAFFFTMKDHETLIAKIKNGYDSVQPSGNSVAAQNLMQLAVLTGNDRYRNYAHEVFKVFAPSLKRTPGGLTNMALAIGQFLDSAGKEKPKDPTPKPTPPKPKAKEQLVTGKAYFNVKELPAGGLAKVMVVLDIKKGWHIYANPPGNDINEATVFEIKSKHGTTMTKVNYPAGKQVTIDLDGEVITSNEYKGEVRLTGIVKVPADAGGKTETLTLSISFQACNDETMVCRMPKPITLTGNIKVAPVGEPVPKANQKLFSE